MDILPHSLHCDIVQNVEWTWDKIAITAQTLMAYISGGINKWKHVALLLFSSCLSQFMPFMAKVITQEIKSSDLEAVWHPHKKKKGASDLRGWPFIWIYITIMQFFCLNLALYAFPLWKKKDGLGQ